jgi:glycosyltransferase EpsE
MNKELNKRNNETVSVIMAVYNCEETVSEAIESILNQTYGDIQLIICNDCSSDNTGSIAKNYADKYPDKIVFIENSQNMKLPFSLNHCLKYATGKYIARMDGDDYSYPERFSEQVKYLNEHGDIDLVGCAMDTYCDGKITGKITSKPHPRGADAIKIPFAHATIMTYAYVYEVLNGYSLEKRAIRVEDADLWIRFFAEGFKGDNLQEAYYRVLEDERTMSRRKMRDRINGYKTIKFGVLLLGLPKIYIVRSFFRMFIGLIPRPIYTFIHKLKYKI